MLYITSRYQPCQVWQCLGRKSNFLCQVNSLFHKLPLVVCVQCIVTLDVICILRECLGWSLWHKYSTLPRILAARSLAGLIYWSDRRPKDIPVPKLTQKTFKAYFLGLQGQPCNFHRINQRPQCQKGFDSLMIGWSVKLKLSTMGRRHGSDQQGQERGTQ